MRQCESMAYVRALVILELCVVDGDAGGGEGVCCDALHMALLFKGAAAG